MKPYTNERLMVMIPCKAEEELVMDRRRARHSEKYHTLRECRLSGSA